MRSGLPRLGMNLWLVMTVLLLAACEDDEDPRFKVPVAAIEIDGSADDWMNISPATTDPEGDDQSDFSGADARSLYIAQDTSGTTIYVMMTFWDGPPNPQMASGNTSDGDAEHPDVQMGYQVFWGDGCEGGTPEVPWPGPHPCAELFARYDTLSGQWYEWIGIPWGIETVEIAGGEVLEFAFPAVEIGSPAKTEVWGAVNHSAYGDRREQIPFARIQFR